MSEPVKDSKAMIAGMKPVLQPGLFAYATFADGPPMEIATAALGVFREKEGVSVIVPSDLAPNELPMRQITLSVNSSLEGVGLTAAVAVALTEANIACNVVAAYHHDHIFVPEMDAERAVAVLKVRAAAEG